MASVSVKEKCDGRKQWKKEINKVRRMRGEAYEGRKYVAKSDKCLPQQKPAKRLKQRCSCKGAYTNCQKISEADREEIFKNIWSMSWEEKRQFVESMARSYISKRVCSADGVLRRKRFIVFNLTTNGELVRVCKAMFVSTTGLTRYFILKNAYCEFKKVDNNINPVRIKDTNASETPTHAHIKVFVESLPSFSSHCGAHTPDKTYVDPTFSNYQQLYREYRKYCSDHSLTPASRQVFMMVFRKLNFDVFKPNNNCCDTCNSILTGAPRTLSLRQKKDLKSSVDSMRITSERTAVEDKVVSPVPERPPKNVNLEYSIDESQMSIVPEVNAAFESSEETEVDESAVLSPFHTALIGQRSNETVTSTSSCRSPLLSVIKQGNKTNDFSNGVKNLNEETAGIFKLLSDGSEEKETSNFSSDMFTCADNGSTLKSADTVSCNELLLEMVVSEEETASDSLSNNCEMQDDVNLKMLALGDKETCSTSSRISLASKGKDSNDASREMMEVSLKHKPCDLLSDESRTVGIAKTGARFKRRCANKTLWKREINKARRMRGEAYEGRIHSEDLNQYSTRQKPAKRLKQRCSCKVAYTNCQKISEADRKEIFKNIWSMSWEEKRQFVESMARSYISKRVCSADGVLRRKRFIVFNLTTNGELVRVCKAMFVSTTGLTRYFILKNAYCEFKKVDNNINPVRIKDASASEQPTHAHIKVFVESLPSFSSHCGAHTPHKTYVDPTFSNYQQLYREYRKYCSDHSLTATSLRVFGMIFRNLNFGIFKPNNNCCDTCDSVLTRAPRTLSLRQGKYLKSSVGLMRKTSERTAVEDKIVSPVPERPPKNVNLKYSTYESQMNIVPEENVAFESFEETEVDESAGLSPFHTALVGQGSNETVTSTSSCRSPLPSVIKQENKTNDFSNGVKNFNEETAGIFKLLSEGSEEKESSNFNSDMSVTCADNEAILSSKSPDTVSCDEVLLEMAVSGKEPASDSLSNNCEMQDDVNLRMLALGDKETCSTSSRISLASKGKDSNDASREMIEVNLKHKPCDLLSEEGRTVGIGKPGLRFKRRCANKTLWKREINKARRMRGEAYEGRIYNDNQYSTQQKPARMLKQRCSCKGAYTNCQKISEAERKEIFENIWSMSWEEKKQFVESMARSYISKRVRSPDGVSRRKRSIFFNLKTNGELVRVCKDMFLSTTGLTHYFVLKYALWEFKKVDNNINPVRIKDASASEQPTHAHIKVFVESLPSFSSHCGAHTPDKTYVDPTFSNCQQLYREYMKYCSDHSLTATSRRVFGMIFRKLNFGIFKPNKNCCDTCDSILTGAPRTLSLRQGKYLKSSVGSMRKTSERTVVEDKVVSSVPKRSPKNVNLEYSSDVSQMSIVPEENAAFESSEDTEVDESAGLSPFHTALIGQSSETVTSTSSCRSPLLSVIKQGNKTNNLSNGVKNFNEETAGILKLLSDGSEEKESSDFSSDMLITCADNEAFSTSKSADTVSCNELLLEMAMSGKEPASDSLSNNCEMQDDLNLRMLTLSDKEMCSTSSRISLASKGKDSNDASREMMEVNLKQKPCDILSEESRTVGIGKTGPRFKRRCANTTLWKKEINKARRMRGEAYEGRIYSDNQYSTQQKPARMLKQRCSCKGAYTNCQKISEAERKEIFENIWSMSWEEKKQFVESMARSYISKRVRSPDRVSRRKRSIFFNLKTNGELVRVCKDMFLSTTGLTHYFVLKYALWEFKKVDNNINPVSIKDTTASEKPTHAHIKVFVESLPSFSSHCDAHTPDKTYVDPTFSNCQQLYREYRKYCSDHSLTATSLRVFGMIFRKLNFDIFKPNKNCCDTCDSVLTGELRTFSLRQGKDLKSSVGSMRKTSERTAVEDNVVSPVPERSPKNVNLEYSSDESQMSIVPEENVAFESSEETEVDESAGLSLFHTALIGQRSSSCRSPLLSVIKQENKTNDFSNGDKNFNEETAGIFKLLPEGSEENEFSNFSSDMLVTCADNEAISTSKSADTVSCNELLLEMAVSGKEPASDSLPNDSEMQEDVNLRMLALGDKETCSTSSRISLASKGKDLSDASSEMIEVSLKHKPCDLLSEESRTVGIGKTGPRFKRRCANTTLWKKEINKARRMRGEAYEGRIYNADLNQYSIQQKPARLLKQRCSCKVAYTNCQKISEAERKEIFENIWSMSWEEKKQFVESMARSYISKRVRSPDGVSRRKRSIFFNLKTNGELVRVCKDMFLSTTGLTHYFVLKYALWEFKKIDNNINSVSIKDTSAREKPTHAHIKVFVESLPSFSSHCDAHTPDKTYVDPTFSNCQQLFREYRKYCSDRSLTATSRHVFGMIFRKLNFDIFKPNKNCCDTCDSVLTGAPRTLSLRQEKEWISSVESMTKTSERNTVDIDVISLIPEWPSKNMTLNYVSDESQMSILPEENAAVESSEETEVDESAGLSSFHKALVGQGRSETVISTYSCRSPLLSVIKQENKTNDYSNGDKNFNEETAGIFKLLPEGSEEKGFSNFSSDMLVTCADSEAISTSKSADTVSCDELLLEMAVSEEETASDSLPNDSEMQEDVNLRMLALGDKEMCSTSSRTSLASKGKDSNDASREMMEVNLKQKPCDILSEEGRTVGIGKTGPRFKRRCANKTLWKKEINKARRMRGEAYEGRIYNADLNQYSIQQKPARMLKQRCSCKVAYTNCQKISEAERKKIFDNVWSMSWEEKKQFVESMVNSRRVKRRKVKDVSRRLRTLVFNLKANGKLVRVCKKMFASTTGLSKYFVNAHASYDVKVRKSAESQKQEKEKPTHTHIRRFLQSLPLMPPFYCEHLSGKTYIETVFESYYHLYREYKNFCSNLSLTPASRQLFMDIFRAMNFDIFKPWRTCNTCVTSSLPTACEESQSGCHLREIELARQEKDSDELESAKSHHKSKLITVDLQFVLPSPNLSTSLFYYKKKLFVHNLSFSDPVNKKATYYIWHEADGAFTAHEFTSCLFDYLSKEAEFDKYIIYCDCKSHLYRDEVMAKALTYFAQIFRKTIIQKFVDSSHASKENETIHKNIVRKLKDNPIYCPADYVRLLMPAAKHHSHQREVRYVDYTFFNNFSSSCSLHSIIPKSDVVALMYTPKGDILYKMNFAEEWLGQVMEKSENKFLEEPSRLYHSHRKIDSDKYQDLQDLKSFLPSDYHYFYDGLSHD